MNETTNPRARVLIESPHEDVRDEHAFVLRNAGFEVLTCGGPTEPCDRCPLVDDGGCALVDEADVIVTSPHLMRSRAIIDALTQSTSAVVIVEGGGPELERERGVLRDARVLSLPVSADELLSAVEEAARPVPTRYWEDFAPGQSTTHGTYRLEEDEIVEFARFFDPQSLHLDEREAACGPYGGLIASGAHSFALAARLIVRSQTVNSASLGSTGVDELRWSVPVRPGDNLTARSEVVEVRPSATDPSRGTVVERHELVNQRGEVVLSFLSTMLVARRSAG